MSYTRINQINVEIFSECTILQKEIVATMPIIKIAYMSFVNDQGKHNITKQGLH